MTLLPSLIRRKAAAASFEQKKNEELRPSDRSKSSGAFDAGAGSVAAGRVAANCWNDYQDQMVKEALRRSVADTAVTASGGGEEDVREELQMDGRAG